MFDIDYTSTLSSTALVSILIFLFRNWITARLSQSIRHEYDEKLANIKHECDEKMANIKAELREREVQIQASTDVRLRAAERLVELKFSSIDRMISTHLKVVDSNNSVLAGALYFKEKSKKQLLPEVERLLKEEHTDETLKAYSNLSEFKSAIKFATAYVPEELIKSAEKIFESQGLQLKQHISGSSQTDKELDQEANQYLDFVEEIKKSLLENSNMNPLEKSQKNTGQTKKNTKY